MQHAAQRCCCVHKLKGLLYYIRRFSVDSCGAGLCAQTSHCALPPSSFRRRWCRGLMLAPGIVDADFRATCL